MHRRDVGDGTASTRASTNEERDWQYPAAEPGVGNSEPGIGAAYDAGSSSHVGSDSSRIEPLAESTQRDAADDDGADHTLSKRGERIANVAEEDLDRFPWTWKAFQL